MGLVSNRYETTPILEDFRAIIELISFDVNLIRESVEPLVEICLTVTSKNAVDDVVKCGVDSSHFTEVRKMAFEVLLSLVEAAPKLCRRIRILDVTVKRGFEFMVEESADEIRARRESGAVPPKPGDYAQSEKSYESR